MDHVVSSRQIGWSWSWIGWVGLKMACGICTCMYAVGWPGLDKGAWNYQSTNVVDLPDAPVNMPSLRGGSSFNEN